MKNYYYVNYYRDFANTYTLAKAPANVALPEGWERITRKEAERLARRERERARYDAAFSGYASDTIEDWESIRRERA